MPRDNKPTTHREHEGTSEAARALEIDEAPDDLDLRADEARELDRDYAKRAEYQEDVAVEMDDLDLSDYQGPDA